MEVGLGSLCGRPPCSGRRTPIPLASQWQAVSILGAAIGPSFADALQSNGVQMRFDMVRAPLLTVQEARGDAGCASKLRG